MEGESIQSQMENGELYDVKIKDEVISTNFDFRTTHAELSEKMLNIISVSIKINHGTR